MKNDFRRTRKITDRVKKWIYERQISRIRGIDISRKSPFSKAERNVTSLSWKKLFSFSRLSLPLLPLPVEKAPYVSAFFTGALLRFTDGLHPLLVCHSNLRHKDKSRFEVSLFSIRVLLVISRLAASLSLFLFFLFFHFPSFRSVSLPTALPLKREIVCENSRLGFSPSHSNFFLWIKNLCDTFVNEELKNTEFITWKEGGG